MNCASAAVESLEAAGGQFGQRLIGLHQRQIQIRRQAEVVSHLSQHLAVLAG